MKESVIYQSILQEGKAEGKAEGKTEASNQIALNMLHSNMSLELVVQLTGLSLKQVQKLQKLTQKHPQVLKPSKTKRSPKS